MNKNEWFRKRALKSNVLVVKQKVKQLKDRNMARK